MARVGEVSATIDGRRVEIRRGDALVAVARWTGRGVEGATARSLAGADAPPAALARAEEILASLEQQLVAEEAASVAAVEAATRAAYDGDGVDLSLIDWMLSLSPLERLAVLQEAVSFFAPLRPDDADSVS